MVIQESAPAKIILFGEHAVVYGQPAIAVPVSSIRARATIDPDASTDAFTVRAFDVRNAPIPLPEDNPLRTMAKMTCAALGIDLPKIVLELRSDIPIASGLGSGAAISAAITRAISAFASCALSDARLNAIVYETEKIHHGTPSGIDNTVIVYERPVYFVREQPIQTIENERPLQILIADTGIPAPTKEAVGDVRYLYDHHPQRIPQVIDAIGHIVRQAREAMKSGDLIRLGALMNTNHEYLKTLTVSSPELDRLVQAAQQAGALGAKLSGGGRGGNMIALVDDATRNNVHQALSEAGATHIIHTTVEPTQ